MSEYVIFGLIAAALLAVWLVIRLKIIEQRFREAEEAAAALRREAEAEAERLKKERLLEAKDEIFRWRVAAEKEIQEQRKKVTELERRLGEKEQRLERESRHLERKKRDVEQRARAVK